MQEKKPSQHTAGVWLHLEDAATGLPVGGIATHYRVEVSNIVPTRAKKYEVTLTILAGGELTTASCGCFARMDSARERAREIQRMIAGATGGLEILSPETIETLTGEDDSVALLIARSAQ